MKDPWILERWRLFTLTLVTGAIGLITQNWTLAIGITTLSYIAYNLWNLRQLERWIRDGAKRANTPNVDGVWALIVQHIRKQKRKDKQRKTRVAEVLSRFNHTVRALPYATVVLNPQREIEWANPAARQLLGIDTQRDLGRRIDNLIREPSFRAFLNLADNDQAIELTSPADEQRRLSVRRTRYKGGQILITARDISESIALQRSRREFVANASHELRTPLTVISGYLEMLGDDQQLPDSAKTALNKAHQQAERMERIIDDLLDLSKLESAPLTERAETLNIERELTRITDGLEELLKSRQNRLKIDIQTDSYLDAVRDEFVSLSTNLLHNASRHNPQGTAIDLRWQIKPQGDGELIIQDHGNGIAAEHLPHLTERFYRVDISRSRASGGTGLGLAIAKHIVQRHGGTLTIDSQLGHGTTIKAQFPAHRIHQGPKLMVAVQNG